MDNKKPLCPYCGPWNGHPDGVEMIHQRESMGMRMGYDYTYCPRCAARGPGVYTQDGKFAGKQKEAMKAALRRFQPMQKPLTLEEAQAIQNVVPVFLERRDGDIISLLFTSCGVTEYPKLHYRPIWSGYGRVWRIWWAYPTDEERAAAKWEE